MISIEVVVLWSFFPFIKLIFRADARLTPSEGELCSC